MHRIKKHKNKVICIRCFIHFVPCTSCFDGLIFKNTIVMKYVPTYVSSVITLHNVIDVCVYSLVYFIYNELEYELHALIDAAKWHQNARLMCETVLQDVICNGHTPFHHILKHSRSKSPHHDTISVKIIKDRKTSRFFCTPNEPQKHGECKRERM